MAINPTFAWSLAWRVHALLCICQNSSSSPTKLASSETSNWRQNACAGCSRWSASSRRNPMKPFTDSARLSLNQITTQRWSVREAVDGCVRAGIPFIGLWREKVAETGLRESACIVRDTGLHVSSLCRGGWFPAVTAAERQTRLDDNRRAIEEAATLGTDVLVLV